MQNNMVILAIETTGPAVSVCISRGGRQFIKKSCSSFSHLEECVPMAKALMEETGIAAEDICAVAVSCGPGSFTGIRIGMATAKGLAQVWGKPVIEVPTLMSFAYKKDAASAGAVICPVFDARRSQVYAASFEWQNDGGVPSDDAFGGAPDQLVSEGAYALSEYLELLNAAVKNSKGARLVFYGDGSRRFSKEIEEYARENGLCISFASDEEYLQDAASVAVLAEKLFTEGRLCDCFTASPNYLRAAEPERRKAAGECDA